MLGRHSSEREWKKKKKRKRRRREEGDQRPEHKKLRKKIVRMMRGLWFTFEKKKKTNNKLCRVSTSSSFVWVGRVGLNISISSCMCVPCKGYQQDASFSPCHPPVIPSGWSPISARQIATEHQSKALTLFSLRSSVTAILSLSASCNGFIFHRHLVPQQDSSETRHSATVCALFCRVSTTAGPLERGTAGGSGYRKATLVW